MQIKEPFITDNIAINCILNYATKGSFCQWSSELYSVNLFNKEFTALDEFKIDPSQTYNLSFWKTIDPIVYGVVDVSSIPLSFIGCDFISDGVGLLYAIPRGNIENSAMYSASFVMVAVSGGTIKVAKQLVSETYGVTRIIASNMVNGRAITESVAAFRLKKMLTLAEDANIADDVLLSFAQLSKNGEISVAQIEKITDAATSPEDKIKYIREAVEEGVTRAGNVTLDVANATEKQLDDIFAGLQNTPPFKYAPNTLEHKAERWAQYKIRLGDDAKDYSAWSNTYNANMTKARTAHQAADDVMASIGWGQREVTVQAGSDTRRMDIADKVARKGVEVKSYETVKVYATEAIKGELNADKFLIDNDFWQIEWVFKGCEPSQPLRTLLEQAGITIKLVP